MSRTHVLAAALIAAACATPAVAQQQQQPPFATTKVEGTDGVYIFRNGGAQAMFIVTKDGVIATDPIGYQRPEGVTDYVNEIRKVTDKPIKYLIYSHHHYDHVAGGQAFKDAGAKIVAHKKAKERLAVLGDPATPLPDETFDDKRTITLGGTALELSYVGLNHSDSSIIMRLPREKIVFVVDFLPVGSVPGRGMIDFYPLEAEQSIKQVLAMDWERLIPGHPGPGGRMGTKDDVRAVKEYLTDLSNATRELANQGKCFDEAMKTLKLPKYESWANYGTYLQGNIERFCEYWGRGM